MCSFELCFLQFSIASINSGIAKRRDFENVYVHCFLDGRDTPPASAEGYLAELEEKMKEKEIGKIASISGRFYAMDRDKRWERVQKCYDALVKGEGNKATSAITAIEDSYQKEVFDEFVEPTVICNGETPLATLKEHDSVIFFNFRPDRAREITRAINDKEFAESPFLIIPSFSITAGKTNSSVLLSLYDFSIASTADAATSPLPSTIAL